MAAVGDSARLYKVGLQLYTAEGPQIVRDLVASGRQVFLDLKFHDIPNTVAAAVKEAAKLGVSMLTVHAAGGGKMLRGAVDASRNSSAGPMILAVTVLTSLDARDLEHAGVRGSVVDQVSRLAALAIEWLPRSCRVGARSRNPARRTGRRFSDRDSRRTPRRPRPWRPGPRRNASGSNRLRSQLYRSRKADHGSE